jgi:hypothetical protein
MSNLPSDDLTVTIPVAGDNQTLVDILQSQYGHLDSGEARAALEAHYPDSVWNDQEIGGVFAVSHFDPPYIHVIRHADRRRGTLMFLDAPRFYFSFNAESDANGTGTT